LKSIALTIHETPSLKIAEELIGLFHSKLTHDWTLPFAHPSAALYNENFTHTLGESRK
jgi:hypothetical protein